MYITTQRLDYADHAEEIAALTQILNDIREKFRPKPFPEELQPTVEFILGRLAYLQVKEKAVLSVFDGASR